MTMRCRDARAALWPPEQPRLAESEVMEARRHLAGCPACATYLRQDRVLLDAYRRVAAEGAPDEVREGVFDVLAQARTSDPPKRETHPERSPVTRRPRRGRALLTGAGLLTAAVAGVVLLRGAGPAAPAPMDQGDVFVEDHLRRAVGEEHILTSDPAAVRAFLARELGVTVATLAQGGLELEGAEICLLEGRRGAVIFYRLGEARLSHYLVPRELGAPRAPRVSETSSVAPGGLLPVVTWASPRVEQALVGEAPSGELLRIARAAER